MRNVNVFALSVIAGVLLVTAAHATNAFKRADTMAAKIVYQGKDSAGHTLFLLTIADPHAVTLCRIPRARTHRSRVNWTALIGSGRAAAQEERR